MENNSKKAYEEPSVVKVEFDFSDRITASGCDFSDMAITDPFCWT